MNQIEKKYLEQLSDEIIPLQEELEQLTFLKNNFDDPGNYSLDRIIKINEKLKMLRDLYFKLLK